MLNEAEVHEYAARQLRTIRATRGLSQTKLARKMNISPQQVYKYEWGINRMSASRVLQFAEALEVSLMDFIPNGDKYAACEPVQPHIMRFIRLIDKIDPRHYEQVYTALKAIARLCGSKAGD